MFFSIRLCGSGKASGLSLAKSNRESVYSDTADALRLYFAFPKEIEARQDEFPLVFRTFYPGIKEEKGIKEYLSSERRLPYSMGIFRNYPELDRE